MLQRMGHNLGTRNAAKPCQNLIKYAFMEPVFSLKFWEVWQMMMSHASPCEQPDF
jgi:hypothetical protein